MTDDRILPLTRAAAWIVIPFLIAAFIILYLDGREVARDNMSEGGEAYRLPALSAIGFGEETAVVRIPIPVARS